MKTSLRYLMAMVVMAMASLHCDAADTEVVDTVYFYGSWEQMMYMEPIAMLVNPYIEAYTPFDVQIYSDDETVNKRIAKTGFISVSLGDSIWLVNAQYIKDNFKGDVGQFTGFLPLFYNEKWAYITGPGKPGFKDLLFGDPYVDEITSIDYYFIDFENQKVKRVTHSYLSQLLEDYHDLQMRYEGMKDYKKREIIEDYFFKYLDRVNQDFLKPYILEIVAPAGSIQ